MLIHDPRCRKIPIGDTWVLLIASNPSIDWCLGGAVAALNQAHHHQGASAVYHLQSARRVSDAYPGLAYSQTGKPERSAEAN